MKIALCDDEKLVRSELHNMIENNLHCLDLLIDEYSTGKELLTVLNKRAGIYEAVFLDIEMNGIDGLKTAKLIREFDSDIKIIFLTNHLEFSLQGYEASAFRYLLKPLNEEKIMLTVKAVFDELQKEKTILIHNSDLNEIVKLKHILYFESDNQNVNIHMNNNIISVRYNLSMFEKELRADAFFRIHRGYLVNLRCVKSYTNRLVQLINGEKLIVSKLKEKEFTKMLHAFVRKAAI